MQSPYGYPYAPFDISSDPTVFGLEARSLTTLFGRMNYVRNRPRRATRRVTLLLHGVGGMWSSWTPTLAAAREEALDLGALCIVDLPGFGISENRLNSLDATDVANALWSIVDYEGWEDCTVVGHSMGGFLALHMASRRPPKLSRVVALSGTYVSVVRSVQHPFGGLVANPSTSLLYQAMRLLAATGQAAPRIVRLLSASKLLPIALSRALAHPKQIPPGVIPHLIDGLRPRSFVLAAKNGYGYDAATTWQNIDVPALATFGSKDDLVPLSDMDWVNRTIPNMQTLEIEDCGHFTPLEQPHQVARIISQAL